jgi:hypothetical protein
MSYDCMPGSVIRWQDDERGYGPLARELRERPRKWAVVAERIPQQILADRMSSLYPLLGDEFEIKSKPIDSGPVGLLYEITARYVGER